MTFVCAPCSICMEIFKKTDEIYSTVCGHLFHYSCMIDWKNCSTCCPQCREYDPETHKIYLTLSDAPHVQLQSFKEKQITTDAVEANPSSNEYLEDLKAQLSNAEKCNDELRQDILYLNMELETHKTFSIQTENNNLLQSLTKLVEEGKVENQSIAEKFNFLENYIKTINFTNSLDINGNNEDEVKTDSTTPCENENNDPKISKQSRSLSILYYPTEKLSKPYVTTVLSLCRLISLDEITKDDIINVETYKSKYLKPYVKLSVEFKTLHVRSKVLENNYKLKDFTPLFFKNRVLIVNYVDNNNYEIAAYAVQFLKRIHFMNGKVMFKEELKSKSDIDDIVVYIGKKYNTFMK